MLARIDVPEDVAVSVLVPNERGLENALALLEASRAAGGGRQAFDEINVFLSASETHNRKNVNRSVEESLAGLEVVLARAREAGLRCEGVISTSFGCPYEGHVPPERVLEIARRLHAAGAQEIGFGDTTGMANPRQVGELFALWRDDLQEAQLTAHFHNTRGQGLANVLAALEAGVDSFESSFGELGGCPVPAGATGNIASEDLVSMLEEMGIETGIDLPALLACAARVQEILGRPLGSHTLVAGPVEWMLTVDRRGLRLQRALDVGADGQHPRRGVGARADRLHALAQELAPSPLAGGPECRAGSGPSGRTPR